MNTAVVCLGANTTDALPRIGQALVFLQGCATVNADSGCYPTEPEYEAAANPYQNRVLVLATDIGYEELYSRSKEFELCAPSCPPTVLALSTPISTSWYGTAM